MSAHSWYVEEPRLNAEWSISETHTHPTLALGRWGKGEPGCRVREEVHSKCVGKRVPIMVAHTFNPSRPETEVGVF